MSPRVSCLSSLVPSMKVQLVDDRYSLLGDQNALGKDLLALMCPTISSSKSECYKKAIPKIDPLVSVMGKALL